MRDKRKRRGKEGEKWGKRESKGESEEKRKGGGESPGRGRGRERARGGDTCVALPYPVIKSRQHLYGAG